MPNRLVLEGLDGLTLSFKQLPKQLAADGDAIADVRSDLAMNEIIDLYPVVTGNLRKGVRKRKVKGGYVVENKAPHALLYEIGTETIRYTKNGVSRGKMPPGKVFARVAPKHRRAMVREQIAMVETEGFVVTGTP